MALETATDVLTSIRTRAVVRSYTAQPVEQDTVDELLAAMLSAPKASNVHAWETVVVRDTKLIRRMRAFAPGILGKPTLVVVQCFDHDRTKDLPQDSRDMLRLCTAMAVQNLLLAVHAMGLGACPVSSFRPAEIGVLLGLPAHLEPLLVVPIGHPSKRARPSERRAVHEVVSYERWGRRPAR